MEEPGTEKTRKTRKEGYTKKITVNLTEEFDNTLGIKRKPIQRHNSGKDQHEEPDCTHLYFGTVKTKIQEHKMYCPGHWGQLTYQTRLNAIL